MTLDTDVIASQSFVASAMALNHESLVQSEVLTRSGGGDLYRFQQGPDRLVCKRVECASDLSNVASTFARWQSLLSGTAWVAPQRLVCGRHERITGNMMAEVVGESLPTGQHATILQLAGRVLYSMVVACEHEIYPMVEHSGNVMMHAESGAACRRPALLDIDACRFVRSDDSLTLQQLPVILMNNDLSRGYSLSGMVSRCCKATVKL